MTSTSNPFAIVESSTGGHVFFASELREAFERVQDPTHWKAPINAVVELDTDKADKGARELRCILDAVEYFTATQAGARMISPGVFAITAAGYWAGPAC